MEMTQSNKPKSKTGILSVLIADDDAPTRILLRAAIAQWGYEVIEAKDGEEAWQIMQRPYAPRLLIVDWLMPKLNGIDLCERVKHELNRYAYIILLTQQSGTTNLIKGLDAGADEFLSKPFNMAELRSRLSIGARIIKYEMALNEKNEKLRNYISQIESSSIGALESTQQIYECLQKLNEDDTELKNGGVNAKLQEVISSLETIISVIKEYRHETNDKE